MSLIVEAPPMRVAIIDDVVDHRQRLGLIAKLAGYKEVPLSGRYRKVQDLVEHVISEKVDGVLCDLRLSEGNFANFDGAQAMGALYDASTPAVLITEYSNVDVNYAIRRFRRKIPALLKMQDVGKNSLRRALEASRQEVLHGILPISRRPRRSLVMIDEVSKVGSGRVVTAFVTQWREEEAIAFPEDIVPKHLRKHLKKNAFFLADVNTDAEDPADLYFDNFELPPA